MNTISILDLANNIDGQITIDGIHYRFYNNRMHFGSYKKFPIANGDRSVDGSWEIVPTDIGYELVTNPSISKDRLFLSISLIPESVLQDTINLTKVLKS